MATKEELLDTFRAEWPTPSRTITIDLVRAYGFKYRKETERVAIYKHPQLPDILITIPSKGEKLNKGTAGQILSTIQILDEVGKD